jgi:hydroxymethylglutaryl-CoA lyase
MKESVTIREVGVREGLQRHPNVIGTRQKLELIQLLSECGLSEIEVTSFVRPDRVPQLADADELTYLLLPHPHVRYTGLYLNEKGFIRGESGGSLANRAWIPLAVSDSFLRKNSNISLQESIETVAQWQGLFNRYCKDSVCLMISTCFGCNDEGPFHPDSLVALIEAVSSRLSNKPSEICLADTMGWGNPLVVRHSIRCILSMLPDTSISLHLHDTRGCGIANAYAGYLEGVRIFDASVGGVGGCPFVEGASGNIATEELVYLFESMGVDTGISLASLRRPFSYLRDTLKVQTFSTFFGTV